MKNQGKKVYIVNTIQDGVLGEFGNIKQAYSELRLYADNVGCMAFRLTYSQVCDKFRSGYEKIEIKEKVFGSDIIADITIAN